MPPKFLSSKVSDLWKERAPKPPPAKRSRRSEEEDELDAEARISSEQLRQLVEQRVAAKGATSERAALASEMSEMKKNKGTGLAKSMNFAELQRKQRRLKELEKEQGERDKELGGGSAIISRVKFGGPKKKKPGKSLRELGMRDGMVKVSRRTIEANSGGKKRRAL
jgi:hypothetical protein